MDKVGSFAVSNEVSLRNSFGQFRSAMTKAGEDTLKDLLEAGANESRNLAPVGHKEDKRTAKIKDSIRTIVYPGNTGAWYSTARHAASQEYGARPHVIRGDPHLRFFWEKHWRMFVPSEEYYNMPGMVTEVEHPGNPARPFLRPAYEIVTKRVMKIAKKNYGKLG
ncbi:MAG: hypothetical protein H0T60_02585 [Acidobacteria bacterium]|nr:hypothetical protein [Acidobacteriota bacterium]